MLTRIISGMQTGADAGGLLAAKHCGLEVGGWMPKGFKNEMGYFPIFAELFGVRETPSSGFGQRTDWNVRDSDGTIIISSNWTSPGTVMTKKVCQNFRKPYFAVLYKPPCRVRDHVDEIVEWLLEQNFETLNVAGNRESVSPGIKVWTTRLLIDVFHMIKETMTQSENS